MHVYTWHKQFLEKIKFFVSTNYPLPITYYYIKQFNKTINKEANLRQDHRREPPTQVIPPNATTEFSQVGTPVVDKRILDNSSPLQVIPQQVARNSMCDMTTDSCRSTTVPLHLRTVDKPKHQ